VSTDVNLWSDSAHAARYLAERQHLPHRLEAYAALVETLPDRVRRVLDLGCGDGEVTARVLAAHPDAEALACDFSPEMLGRARERFADVPAVTVVEHDLDDPLPVAWGIFDVIVSAFAIHHVVDARKRALYGEVFQLLEPGGIFCNLEHVDSPTPELHEAFLVAIGKSLAEDDPSNKLVAVETQLTWLRELGFEHVDCHWKWREMALLAGVTPGA
jgi:tRNA (cmo5U34)-methyltransferase